MRPNQRIWQRAGRLAGVSAMVGALLAPTAAHAQGTEPPGTAADALAATDQLAIRLLEAPVDREDDPRARVYVVDHVAPGTTITRTVSLGNHSSAPLTVAAYAGAGEVGDGAFTFGDGAGGNELTEWTTLEPAQVEVAPGADVPATLTIDVPADASPGERYAVAWAETTSPAPDGSGVRQVNRVGIRIYLSVGPGGEPSSDFTIDDLHTDLDAEGRNVMVATVANTGGRALDLGGQLALGNGPAGLDAGPFPTLGETTLGVGESGEVSVPLDARIPGGAWDATLTLASGRVEHDSTARVDLAGPAAPAAPAGDDDGGPPFLALIGGVIAALVAAVLATIVLRRRRTRRLA